VIAVPEQAEWVEPSDEAPGVKAALPEAHPSQRVKKPDASDEEPLKRAPTDETPRGAFFGSPGSDEASEGPDFVDPEEGKQKTVVGSAQGGRPVKVRRILVECALCGYHVAVPPELFGKTVHCPECRANMVFSESSLEPVKDEIIGRIAMDHAERRVLEHAIPGPIPSPAAVMRAHRRTVVVVLLLLAALLGGVIALAVRLFVR